MARLYVKADRGKRRNVGSSPIWSILDGRYVPKTLWSVSYHETEHSEVKYTSLVRF